MLHPSAHSPDATGSPKSRSEPFPSTPTSSRFLPTDVDYYATQVPWDRDVVCWRYYDTSDDLGIFYVKALPGSVAESDTIFDCITADYDSNNKLVCIDIDAASTVLPPCHFLDTAEAVYGKPQFSVKQQYDALRDEFTIFFVTSVQPASLKDTDDPNIVVGLDPAGKIVSITVKAAARNIAYN
mmetsp:Transcript_18215/g.39207  ORF Transcript_18215/g.39207 Transcript_18215/m.39207 type:complete len:183 (+) Transcript_18215:148-696(+)